MAKVAPSRLTIYDSSESQNLESVQCTTQTQSKTSIGRSTMNLVSEVQEKYKKAVKMYSDFVTYASSTEGVIKLSVMGVGMLGGVVLAFRSNSKRKWYRRMLPVGTLTLAAAACHPTHAYSISRNVAVTSYSASVYLYNGTKKFSSYVVEKYKNFTPPPAEAPPQEEKVYFVGDGGITEVQGAELKHRPQEDVSSSNEQAGTQETLPMSSTILQLLPKSLDLNAVDTREDSEVLPQDLGQSSAEDKDLYTTRS